MIVAVNELASQQSAPTQAKIKKFNILMSYAHAYFNATIRYYSSDMCLHIDSDVAYLVQPRARSQVAGYFYLSSKIPQGTITPDPKPNGSILTECRTIRNVMSSAAEADTIGIFHNGKVAVSIRTTLNKLGNPQAPTTIIIHK